ncbi:MAG: HDOD domain-containing protein [Thiohalomonadaceae bacterium]
MEGRHGVIYRLTRLLYPLSELADAGRHALARRARVLRLPPRARLLAAAEQPWITYLLKGEVSITGPAGFSEHIPGGSPRARRPLFEHGPGDLEAVVQSGAIVLRFERAQVGNLMTAQQQASTPVELAARVLQLCRAGEPAISRLPAGVHRMQELLAPGMRLKDLAQGIARQPELEQAFLEAVNRGHGPHARTTPEAVLRLGLPNARALALCLALRPLFDARDPGLRRRMEDTFTHSLAVGCLAHVLARQHAPTVAERALLAGLLHDLGVVAVLGVADAHPELCLSGAELHLLVRRLRALTGPVLIARLGLARDFAGVAEHAERWFRASPHMDLIDLVTLAHLLEEPQPATMQARLEDTPVFRKLGWPGYSPQRAARLLGSARSMAATLRRCMD